MLKEQKETDNLEGNSSNLNLIKGKKSINEIRWEKERGKASFKNLQGW